MRLTILTMPTALLLCLCVSCNNQHADKQVNTRPRQVDALSAENADTARPVAAEYAKSADATTVEDQAATDDAPHQNPSGKPIPLPVANPDWDKKIIKTADLSIETKSFAKFTDRLHRLVRESGGYVSREEQTQNPAEIDNSVSIRVPVDRFDDLLRQLPADSDQLKEKKINSQDVSLELVDTKSRLETKREVRDRYLALLRQAGKMKDILAIQEEIDGVQEDMDAAAGRISYLGHSAAYSTINLRFFQVLDAGAVQNPARPDILQRIKDSFLQGWDFVSTVALGLLSVWPLCLTAALGWGAWRRHRNRLLKRPA